MVAYERKLRYYVALKFLQVELIYLIEQQETL